MPPIDTENSVVFTTVLSVQKYAFFANNGTSLDLLSNDFCIAQNIYYFMQ